MFHTIDKYSPSKLQLCLMLLLLMAFLFIFRLLAYNESFIDVQTIRSAIASNLFDKINGNFFQSDGDDIERRKYHRPKQICPQNALIPTAKSNASSYSDIEANVFRPLGYRIAVDCIPIPILERMTELNCNSVFADWLAISNSYNYSQAPPKSISPNLIAQFLLNNYSTIGFDYRNDKEASGQYGTFWTKAALDARLVNTSTISEIVALAGYSEAMSVYHATRKYSIANKIGMVIGSQRPWVELLCVRNGAKKVITAEYRKINIDHDRFGYVHPIDLANNWQTYSNLDFIVSFSSIEHSGLGRYGDAVDPIGDLREMQKTYCQLKKGAMIFLGIPIGQDSILYNLHRYYGTMRLALMFTDFVLIDVFDGGNQYGISLTSEMLRGSNGQVLFVLQKI